MKNDVEIQTGVLLKLLLLPFTKQATPDPQTSFFVLTESIVQHCSCGTMKFVENKAKQRG